MTREEAIKWLNRIEDKYIHGGDDEFDAKRKQAIAMAIEALKDRPKGEWILHNIVCREEICLPYECPNCGFRYGRRSNFCRECGADMRGWKCSQKVVRMNG